MSRYSLPLSLSLFTQGMRSNTATPTERPFPLPNSHSPSSPLTVCVSAAVQDANERLETQGECPGSLHGQ
jgi:hypothetical protein